MKLTVKELKEFLSMYKDEQEVIIKGQSGIVWELDRALFARQILTDQKREVCKLVLK